MKLFLGFCICLCIICLKKTAAQTKSTTTIPIALREVSGLVKDSIGKVLENVSVKLVSEKDTLQTNTNNYGYFIYRNVKSAEFTLSFKALGFETKHQKYLNNDTKARIILTPIILQSNVQLLNQVIIKGKVGPKYLKDTVEFWAADYIIRDYAKLEELLKKMEGVEIDKQGNVTHEGKEVKQAKFNGVRYFGGDIKAAIKELPANIVERIQIIDDYGENGVKDGQAEKMLNVVTKADKSVGNMSDFTVESNFNNRNNDKASYKRIDGYDQRQATFSFNQIPAGIKQTGLVGTISNAKSNIIDISATPTDISNGKLTNSNATLVYNNRLSSKTNLETNYIFSQDNSNIVKSNLSEEYYQNGLIYSQSLQNINSQVQTHNLNGIISYRPNNKTIFSVNTLFNYKQTERQITSNKLQTGALDASQNALLNNIQKIPRYNITVQYAYKFSKSDANLLITMRAAAKIDQLDMDDINNIERTSNNILIHNRTNSSYQIQTQSINSSLSYPILKKLKLEITNGLNFNYYYNNQVVNNVDQADNLNQVDSLSRDFNYNIIETPIMLRLNYSHKKFEFKAGVKMFNYLIHGSFKQIDNIVTRNDFSIRPTAQFGLILNKRMSINLRYNSSLHAPSFEQILPITNIKDPLNRFNGNINLKNSFVHRPDIGFNYYNIAQQLNLSFNSSISFNTNKIVTNQLLIQDPILGIRRETTYNNVRGDYNLNAYYNASKAFAGNKYVLKINGTASYNNSVFLNNNFKNTSKSTLLSQQLNLIATPLKWLDITPNIKVDYSKVIYNNTTFPSIKSNIIEFNVYGKAYLNKLWAFGFDVGKNYISGIGINITRNPSILNFNLEKRMFKQKDALFSVVVMDALKQNNFISRNILSNGFVDSKSNTNSRYFLVQFSWAPQKFTAGNNVGKKRLRDGSFVD